MRVYLQPPQESRGLQRIADALTRYAPQGVTITPFHDQADLVIIYAIGRRERILGQTRYLLERRKKYAVIQVCLRSTMSPYTEDWRSVWAHATVTWSYYDLQQAIRDDGGDIHWPGYNFLHAPLGVDSSVFYPRNKPRQNYIVATSGVSRLQESVRECVEAVKQVNGRIFHVGDRSPSWQGIAKFSDGMRDEDLALHYSACEFVSGLRRKEGFELPAAEGLLCGARPLLFDSADYRFNYKHWGVYLKEGTRQEVVDQLVEIFKQGAEPVTQQEREEAAHWFNWERLCGEFWQRCLA